jgi:hypothetical protein
MSIDCEHNFSIHRTKQRKRKKSKKKQPSRAKYEKRQVLGQHYQEALYWKKLEKRDGTEGKTDEHKK